MSNTYASTEDQPEPGRYEIRIKGHLDDRWANWFEGLTLSREDNGETRLTGPVADQTALHGLLRKVRDLGLPLVSVVRVETKRIDGPQLDAHTGSYPGNMPRDHHPRALRGDGDLAHDSQDDF